MNSLRIYNTYLIPNKQYKKIQYQRQICQFQITKTEHLKNSERLYIIDHKIYKLIYVCLIQYKRFVKQRQMGGQESAPEGQAAQTGIKKSMPDFDENEEDHYVLEDPKNLSFTRKSNFTYYWVDPKIFNSENQKYERFLNKSLHIEGISSMDGLQNQLVGLDIEKKVKVICAASLDDQDYRRLQSNDRILYVILFCQNQERAKLLMNNFEKIKFAKFDIVELRDSILRMEQEQNRSSPLNNVMFVMEDDTHLLNKYRINFHALTCPHHRQKARNDYLTFLKQMHSDKSEEVSKFQQRYKIDLPPQKKHQQTLDWCFKSNLYWDSIQTMPKLTTNPKVIAYLRFPFRQLYEAIRKSYTKETGQAYMVLTLTQDEISKLKENVNNFLIFTTFVKAYSTQKAASKQFKKTPNSFFVRIILPNLHKGNSLQPLDFGFYKAPNQQNNPDIVFNIYNFFLIYDFEPELREIILAYGSLAQIAYNREHRRQNYRLNPFQQNLMRNFDYLEDLTTNVDSQAAVLQMSGYFKQSLEVYDKRYQNIRKSQPSQDVLDKYSIQLGDAYKMDDQFRNSQAKYNQVSPSSKYYFKALVHLADLYIRNSQEEKLSETVKKIQNNMQKNEDSDKTEVFKAKNFIGMDLMNKGQYKQAGKLYKRLVGDINEYYNYKYQGIPLVHDINRNRAACETKLNNFTEALNLLDSTKSWQRICEGKRSPGLLITQKLIRNVHESRGDIEKSKESGQSQTNKVKKMISLPPTDLNQSPLMVNVNNSMPQQNIDQSSFQIQTSNPKPPSKLPPLDDKPKKPAQLLQESAFNIEDV